jgi:chromosome partitioning protein
VRTPHKNFRRACAQQPTATKRRVQAVVPGEGVGLDTEGVQREPATAAELRLRESAAAEIVDGGEPAHVAGFLTRHGWAPERNSNPPRESSPLLKPLSRRDLSDAYGEPASVVHGEPGGGPIEKRSWFTVNQASWFTVNRAPWFTVKHPRTGEGRHVSRTVAFLNKKGGVGKTSCVHHLAGTLARRSLRTLVVDVDPQASLTQGLLGPDAAEELDPRETVAAIFDESGVTSPRDLVRPTAFPNIALIAGHEAAERYNEPEPWSAGMRQYILRDAIAEVSADFDLVLIDCPPHIQLWAWSALVAAHGVVVPLQAEDYGAQGLKAIRRTIARVRAESNAGLALIGYLVTMYNKALSVHVTYDTYLRELYPADVFQSVVPLAKDYKEAVTFRKPVVEHKPRSAAAKAMAALADEFLARLEDRIPDTSRRVA